MEKFKKFLNPKAIMVACILTFMLVMTIICAILDANAVSKAVKEFDSSNFNSIEDSLVLLPRVSDNIKVQYESNDKHVVISHTNAIITRPEFDDGDLNFKINVTFSKGFVSKTQSYDALLVKDDHDVKSISELLTEQDEKVKLKNATVSGKDRGGIYLNDGNDFVYLQMSGSTALYNVGDVVEVRAFRKVVNNQVFLANHKTLVKTSTTPNPTFTATSQVATIAQAKALATTSEYLPVNYKFVGVTLSYKVIKGENDKDVEVYTITDASGSLTISSNSPSTNLSALKSYLLVKVDGENTYPDAVVDITLMISKSIVEGDNTLQATYAVSQLKK